MDRKVKLYVISIALVSIIVFGSACIQELKKASVADTVQSFSSKQEFKEYLQKSPSAPSTFYGVGGFGAVKRAVPMATEAGAPTAAMKMKEPSRVSKTNVQVRGIDEPDIVKTDGNQIYFSSKRYWGNRETKLIDAFPVKNISVLSTIDKSGSLFLQENMLTIFSGDEIYGYDITKPSSPDEEWDVALNGSMVDARLYNDKIYIVTKNRIDRYHPCPIRPLSVGGSAISIRCSRIYHPVSPISVDVTYNAVVLEPETGKVEKTLSFVGSSRQSVVYMSKNGIYITYYYSKDQAEIYYNFFKENEDLISSSLMNDIERLNNYDISNRAKSVELQIMIQRYKNSLDKDEGMRFENEFQNRMTDFYKQHMREFEKTGIVKIDIDSFEVSENGNVPGRPLNQFSLDEYKGNLRIATTVGERDNSVNDVYVLNKSLKRVGSVKDLGKTERIYSVRFMGDKGYVVTYRQTDPFYVLDLSNPGAPTMEGKLKIPGYSSYLHPIDNHTMLGIGKEDRKVKISMFDVSSPKHPEEIDKYNLDEYWSDISNTHHAFLLDSKHKIFFLPGSKGGYVFSYDNSKLELVKAIQTKQARRALYIDDYLYIVAEEELTVLNERNWNEVKSIGL